MRVSEGGFGDRHRALGPQPPVEFDRPQLAQRLPAAVDRRQIAGVRQLQSRFSPRWRRPIGVVHRDVGDVTQQFGVAVGGRLGVQQVGPLADECGRQTGIQQIRFGQHRFQEGDIGCHALDLEFTQCAACPHDRGGVVAAPRGQLHQHRIEVRADGNAGADRAAVQPDASPGRRRVRRDHPGVGTERVLRVLGGNPALDGCAARLDVVLAQPDLGQRFPGRNA